MKKAFILCTLLCLNACVYAGEIDVWSGRRAWFDNINSYSIDYKNNAGNLVKSDYVSEKSYKIGELRTAFKGYSVLSDKIILRNYYVKEQVRANMDGTLSSASAPYVFHRNQVVNVVGTVNIDGTSYSLVPTFIKDFVVLADNSNGEIYPYTGMIKNKRLVLLRQEYVSDQKGFRLLPVYLTRIEQSKPVDGFDVKYDGIRMNRMWFIYYDYDDNVSGEFKEYSFPAKIGLINLRGVKLRILSVDEQRIDYMIVDS